MGVDDALANLVLDRLANGSDFPRQAFRYEIQDDFQSLYISVRADHCRHKELARNIRHIAELLKDLMPVRAHDFSWVVGFVCNGEVVESCFGGNSAIPDWNGEQFIE